MAAKCKNGNDTPDITELQKEMCKRSLAGENCTENKEEKQMKCFPESSKPEIEENCLVGNIDKTRRAFVKHKKEALTTMGTATFNEIIAKQKTTEITTKVEEPKGAIYEFDEFKTPFSESNSTMSDEGSPVGPNPGMEPAPEP